MTINFHKLFFSPTCSEKEQQNTIVFVTYYLFLVESPLFILWFEAYPPRPKPVGHRAEVSEEVLPALQTTVPLQAPTVEIIQ